jgi:hypothetical protein
MTFPGSRRSKRSAIFLALVLTACGGPGGEDSSQFDPRPAGPVVPVVTSVVGLGPSGTTSTTGASGSTTGGRTTSTSRTANTFGESENPISVPTTPPSAVDPAAAAAAEGVARSFLEQFWAPGARTSSQVADAVAPFATPRLLAVYRDPAHADEAIPGAGISAITVNATAVTPVTATVVGRGTMADPAVQPVFRTLTLLVGSDAVWRVEAVK